MAEQKPPEQQFYDLQIHWQKQREDYARTHASSVKFSNRNRYPDVLALEGTRVMLVNHPVDYINANYVDGPPVGEFNGKHAYISTQAPIASTMPDFWRMVWQEKCSVIVMLTREIEKGYQKAEQYWPAREEDFVVFGPFQITLLKCDTIASHKIIIRTMLLENSEAPDERRYRCTSVVVAD